MTPPLTDEQLVEIAAAAIIERFAKYSDTPDMRQSRIKMASDDARAALSAIAPHLIARGLREGIAFVPEDEVQHLGIHARALLQIMRDRAEALEKGQL